MPWWAWIVLGAALLATELFLIDTGFYLVFLGAAALAVGALALLGGLGPAWFQHMAFGALAVVLLVGFRRRLYEKLRRPGARVSEGVVGEIAIAREAIGAGAIGQVELRGAIWSARNLERETLSAGERARVERVEGLMLQLRRPAS